MTQMFDASAVLAVIFEEPGADQVEALWAEGDNLLCAVNYAEIVAKLAERGMVDAEIATVLEGIPLDVIPFDRRSAHQAGLLRPATKALGLSLGDRTCLALGMIREARVVTADRSWKKVKGVDVEVVR